MRIAICWLLILASVAGMFAINVEQHQEISESAGDGGIALELMARYSVGAHQLLSNFAAGADQTSIDRLRSIAKTPADQLRLIPVIDILQSDSAAADAAEKLLQETLPDDVKQDAKVLAATYSEPGSPIGIEDRDRLADRYGWFGELAAAPNDPMRQDALDAGRRTVMIVLGAGILGILFLLGGLALLITFWVWYIDGHLPPRLRPPDGQVSAILLEGFTVYICAMVVLPVIVKLIAHASGFGWNVLLVLPVGAAFAWIGVRGVSWSQLADGVGWRRGRGIGREVCAGIVGYISGIPVIAAAVLISGGLAKVSGAHPSHPIFGPQTLRELHTSIIARVLVFLLACVFAPVVEETMFRGMLLGHLRAGHRWIVSAILVSLLFAAVHPQGWTAIPILGSIAMVLAALREQRGSLIASMTAHAMNNFLVMVLLLGALV